MISILKRHLLLQSGCTGLPQEQEMNGWRQGQNGQHGGKGRGRGRAEGCAAAADGQRRDGKDTSSGGSSGSYPLAWTTSRKAVMLAKGAIFAPFPVFFLFCSSVVSALDCLPCDKFAVSL